ncbi:MAG: hypothetical protein IKF72_13450 [Kiritimatiellae bacterium]|nr:hypothetical protein [Kiritimatiellia bacterium]
MKRLAILLLSFATVSSLASERAEESSGSAGGYVGAGASLTLPQGGSSMRRLGGGSLRVGWYLGEFWAVEGEAAWLEDSAGLGVDALLHLQAWSLYGDLFGYSRFDPFVTAGARGWIGGAAGQVGPAAGVGAFWHLTEDWSLRFDAGATLGVDSRVETVYTLAAGVQRTF